MRRARRLLFGPQTTSLELLHTPIHRLGLRLEGSVLDPLVHNLHGELAANRIHLRPVFYLSDEYGTLEGTSNVGLGFWDADERLRQTRLALTGESHSESDLKWLVRHEAGHAFCYSHRLYRLPRFRNVFNVRGHFFRTYPAHDRYRVNPWSRDFVNPDGAHYAQKHPDDDFAETFATWLDPRSSWKRVYAYKPGALRKLTYVGELVAEYGRRRPAIKNNPENLHLPVESLRTTVGRFFGVKAAELRRRAPGYIDPDLKKVFDGRPRRSSAAGLVAAPALLRQERRKLRRSVLEWVDIAPSVVDVLLDKVSSRSRALDLVVRRSATTETVASLTSFLTALAGRYRQHRVFFGETA